MQIIKAQLGLVFILIRGGIFIMKFMTGGLFVREDASPTVKKGRVFNLKINPS